MNISKRKQSSKYIFVAAVVGIIQIVIIAFSMIFQAYTMNLFFSELESVKSQLDSAHVETLDSIHIYFYIAEIMSFLVIVIAIMILWFNIELLRKFKQDMARNEHTAGCKDELTGLMNRKYIEKYLPGYITKCGQGYLFMCDMDNFKKINDTLGHNVGDEVLKDFSDILRGVLRNNDRICRLGGDEFMIFVPSIDEEGANAVYARLRDKLVRTFAGTNKRIVTLSCGATLYDFSKSFQDNYQRADKALYYVKESGKNSFCLLK